MSDDIKWRHIQARLNRLQTVEVFQKLRSESIEPVILKGVAIARFYPPESPRMSVDIDVAVAPQDYERSVELFERGALGAYNIDLHIGLTKFDTRDWDEIFSQTRLITIDEGSFRILKDEDQLRVACVHWLAEGGERKSRLWDIHHMIEGRAKDFDWSYFLEANGPVRRRWLVAAIGLACRYTGLKIENFPAEGECKDLPDWLIKTVESRWADEVKFAPIDSHLKEPLMFLRQLRRRFPPNPLIASIALGKDLDRGRRFPIQARYFAKRTLPSLRRTIRTLWNLRTK